MNKYQYDVFISYAGEDREFTTALVEALQVQLVDVWYDQFELQIGDSLRSAIERGLAESQYGIVVLSQRFFEKQWPQIELDSLIASDTSRDRILPIWHGIDHARVQSFSPILAGRVAMQSNQPLEEIVARLLGVIRPGLEQRKAGVLHQLSTMSETVRGFLVAELSRTDATTTHLRIVLEVVRDCLAALGEAMLGVKESQHMADIGLIISKVENMVYSTLQAQGYCVHCKTKVDMFAGAEVVMKNGRRAAKGRCPECGTGMYRILGK